MKWFSNLLIRWKLTIGFGFVILFTVILAFISILTSNNIDSQYTYLLHFPQERLVLLKDIRFDLINMRRLAVTAILETEKPDLVRSFSSQFDEAYAAAIVTVDEYIQTNNTDTQRDSAILREYNSKAEDLKKALTTYKTQIMDPAVVLSLEGNMIDAKNILASGGSIIGEATDLANELCDAAESFLHESSDSVTAQKDSSILVLVILSAVIVLLSLIIAFFISELLARPLQRLLGVANDLVKGNLNVNRHEASKDEVGQLTLAMYKFIDIILLLIEEIDGMGEKFTEGDIEASINTSHFEGSYKIVAERVSSMSTGLVNEVLVFMDCLNKFGHGDFNADIPKLPGKKVVMNKNLDTMRNNLQSVTRDIASLIKDASVGKLSARVDVKKYSGDWADLLNNLNQLMETIIAPINEAAEVLRKVSLGSFDNKVEGNYQGDFMMIKTSINDTVTNVASYINEISAILGNIADNDNLDQQITREYVGKFSDIKNAINNIISKFNNVFSDISAAADLVANGARQISESSMKLAQGATEQASTIEELNATVTTINESTLSNAENAKTADNLAGASQKNAQVGNKNMNDMLTSMEGINDASNNISKIIKTIDDIAFQTNLLALNAAVEAARAGQHGKGFAIVAEEVRNLAARSQTAAKETASLIEESAEKTKNGTKIADTTADALRIIVDDAVQVSDIISGIAEASAQQAEAIHQVTLGISQITDVVQSNSATSEEAASASQELSSQADVLNNLVSIFKLKKI